MAVYICMLAIFLGLFFAPHHSSRAAGMSVWAVDDAVRIDPQTGKAFEENEIYPSRLRIKPGYRDRNWIFDRATRRVSLTGARNEVLAFQVQVESNEPLTDVTVTVSDLKGPATFPARRNVRLFKEWYIEVEQPSHGSSSAVGFDCLGAGWYPDPLIPLDPPERGVKREFSMPFDVPDRTNAVPGQKVQGVWADVYIPRDQKAGDYQGTIGVTARGGGDVLESSLELRIEVLSFTLPDENHLGISLNDYGSISPRRMPREKLWAFYQMCRRHRCVLDVLYNSPKTSGTGNALEMDWTAYDANFGPLFDGTAFTEEYGYDGPGAGVPVKRFYPNSTAGFVSYWDDGG